MTTASSPAAPRDVSPCIAAWPTRRACEEGGSGGPGKYAGSTLPEGFRCPFRPLQMARLQDRDLW